MPWTKKDAKSHTKKADSSKLQSVWSKVANDALKQGDSDASAVKQANAVVKRQSSKKK